MYVCICNAVTEAQVRASVASGAQTLEDLQLDTGLATCCGTCAEAAAGYLPGACAERLPAHAALGQAPACAPVRWVSRAPQVLPKAA